MMMTGTAFQSRADMNESRVAFDMSASTANSVPSPAVAAPQATMTGQPLISDPVAYFLIGKPGLRPAAAGLRYGYLPRPIAGPLKSLSVARRSDRIPRP
jgi:hypothetical protein